MLQIYNIHLCSIESCVFTISLMSSPNCSLEKIQLNKVFTTDFLKFCSEHCKIFKKVREKYFIGNPSILKYFRIKSLYTKYSSNLTCKLRKITDADRTIYRKFMIRKKHRKKVKITFLHIDT